MNPLKRALLIFMRHPEPGCVKTRLAAGIGPAPASQIYEKLLRATLGVAADFKWKHPAVDLFVFFTPPEKRNEILEAFPGPWNFLYQQGGHLGERMGEAIQQVMGRGFSQVLLVGTDLAEPRAEDFDEAFQALDEGYSALGPASDGGFYLIGLDRPCPSVFQPQVWGTGEVLVRTERLLTRAGLRVKRLREKRDIDSPEDIEVLEENPEFRTDLSVIIPTLGSIEQLEPFLQRLRKQIWPDDEIIVVQAQGAEQPGGPHDPIQIAQQILAVASPRGRGLQLNRGAGAAKGGLLFFLHDDSVPPPNFAYSVRKLCRMPQAALGCFRLAFSPSTPALGWIARWANLRTRLFDLPYGDQGIFCRREVYDQVGGFKKPHLMEDVDFVRNCRRRGHILVLHDSMTTSPSRYLRHGILRASLRNHLTMLLYRLGVSDRKLYEYYYRRTLHLAGGQPSSS
jgi:rSAM/selenodomain-associated transferase 2/rSAM/selenodomain-associated transferase 1